MPDIDAQREFYNKRWSGPGRINSIALQRAMAILTAYQVVRPNLPNPPTILDLGSGRGWLSSMLAVLGPTTAIELSDEAVETARQQYPTVEFHAGDLFKVGRTLGTFDVIVSQEVIEHVEDQQAFIDLAADALNPGGYLIFTTPNAWVQAHRTQREHENWGLQLIENWIDVREVRRLLKSGFVDIDITTTQPGFGTTGICRLTNSHKLLTLLGRLGVKRAYQNALMRIGFGLHLVVTARKPK